MSQQSGRYAAPAPATVAEGWALARLTPPSRLHGANGLRTGKDGRIYVAQVAGSQVSAIDPDSGVIETISPLGGHIVGPDDLVFDDAGNLYVTEITENRVRVLRPNGSSDVVQGDMPVANPITFHQGRLIAGECRMGARIMELDRAGGAPRVILDDLPMVNAFEVGPDGKLYFPVMGLNQICRVNLDGSGMEVVAGDLGVPDSVKFGPDGMIVSTQVASGQVLKIDPRTGAQTVLADIGPGLDNVTFVGNRTFVSHISGSVHEIIAPGTARPLVEKGFQWPMGVAVAADGTAYVADGGFGYTIAPGGQAELRGMLFTPGYPGFTRGVAASGAAGEWIATTSNGEVKRYRPAELASEDLATGFDRLMGVALAADGAVAFAEWGTGKVHAARDGQVSELASGLSEPMGVAIAGDGTVFVAEAGKGRVVKLAGGRSETVLDGLGKPEGIAVAGGHLYVLDTLAKQIVRSDLSGGAREVLASGLPVGAPQGMVRKYLGAVGDMAGPMINMAGLAVAGDGAVVFAGDAEGSVLGLRQGG